MFRRMSDSLAKLNRPDNVSLHFIFVENDDALHIGDCCDDFKEKLAPGETVFCDFEPRPGIPVVRNRVLEAALDSGGTYLAFIDDDEIADVNWLHELYAEAEARELDLVGGPVRMESTPMSDLSVWEKLVYRDLCSRQEKSIMRSTECYESGSDDATKVFTSNMMCRLDFVRQNPCRFDEALRFSHGEDYDFYLQVKNADGVTGYAPKALVHEMVHKNRLSPMFQFRLSRNAARASYNIRYARNRERARRELLRSSGFVIWKMILGCARLCLACFNRGRSFVRGLKGIAAAMGRAEGMLGMQDAHYKSTDGH